MAKRKTKKIPQWVIVVPVALIIAAIGYRNIGNDRPVSVASTLDEQRTINFFYGDSRRTKFKEEDQLHCILTAD